ncbi:MFS transporter [Pseudenhygromyxa sp. WMMC2535]|uniref:NTP/NDP exchange transporter n=1 Tax=Pseudenhygromyxa sp. WMMC2535 TaxID=2712867 RepID=UPI0015528078|nr:MFS transporter [Pseudenhygromyxa sp. WMMC2535]NVB41396.1 MFS transporter [Pseudenhygromyxa sp. WMMC2535]
MPEPSDRDRGPLRRLAELRPGEGRRVALAALWFCCLLTCNYTLRPLRDAMGVAGGVDSLHWLFTATFVAMLAIVPLYGLAVAKLGRARLVRAVHHSFALQLLVFWAVMQGVFGDGPALQLWTARVFFVWSSVFNLFVISLFWSVMTDLFSRTDAGRLFGLISVGGTVGAIAGPSLGLGLSLGVGTAWLAMVGVALLELALWCMRGVSRAEGEAPSRNDHEHDLDHEHEHDPERPLGGSPFAAIPELLRSPTLLGICAFILLLTSCSTLLYFIQARIIALEFHDHDSRAAVFAAMDLGVNALTLITQAMLTGRLIRRLGLAWVLAAIPLLCALGFAALALAPVLAALIAVQLLRRAGNYALTRPAREVLYTAIDRPSRYKAKSFIDTVVYRGGDALTGWAFAGLEGLGLGLGAIATIGVPLAGLWAIVAWGLGRHSSAQRDSALIPDDP